MAAKKLKKKAQRKSTASKLTKPVADTARDVYLAGLGALNVAQQEGGKVLEQGSKLFDRLVEEGSKLESRTRKDIEGAVSNLRGEVDSRLNGVKERTESVRKQAADNWDKLEKIFEERVARAMASLGIPTRDDINRLSQRVQELSDQVASLRSGKASTGKTSKAGTKKTKSKAVKKTGVKKAGPKKS